MTLPREDWMVAIEEAANAAASKYGLYVGAHWSVDEDGDGGLELIVARSDKPDPPMKLSLHGRISAVTNDDEAKTRVAWWCLAWQGHGGTHIDMRPTPEAAAKAVRSMHEMFRAEDSQRKGLG